MLRLSPLTLSSAARFSDGAPNERESRDWNGFTLNLYAMQLGGRNIWGATAVSFETCTNGFIVGTNLGIKIRQNRVLQRQLVKGARFKWDDYRVSFPNNGIELARSASEVGTKVCGAPRSATRLRSTVILRTACYRLIRRWKPPLPQAMPQGCPRSKFRPTWASCSSYSRRVSAHERS